MGDDEGRRDDAEGRRRRKMREDGGRRDDAEGRRLGGN